MEFIFEQQLEKAYAEWLQQRSSIEASGTGGSLEHVADTAAAMDDDPDLAESVTLLSLAETYAYARDQCERYRALPLERVEAFEDWAQIPILRRSELDADLMPVVARDAKILAYTATSATTTGRALYLPVVAGEDEALAKYHAVVYPHLHKLDGIMVRMIAIGRFYAPARRDSVVLYPFDPNAAREDYIDIWDYLIAQLYADFPVARGRQRCTAIHSTPPHGLSLLTRHMLDRGYDPRETRVRSLLVSGAWTGKHTRAWLRESWNASVLTSYSCTEMPDAVDECPLKPHRYHFHHVTYPEVVDAQTEAPVAVGETGKLLLTGIYPFSRGAMLLRYDVGDFVRWLGVRRCECGRVAATMDLLGRTQNVAWADLGDGKRTPLAAIPVLEAVDRIPGVPTSFRPQYRYDVGRKGEVTTVQLTVEVHAALPGDWDTRTTGMIRERLLVEEPALASAVTEGRAEIVIHLRRRSQVSVYA